MQKYEVVYASVAEDNTIKFKQEFVRKDWLASVGQWLRPDCYQEARAVTDDKNKLLHRLQRNTSVVCKHRMVLFGTDEVIVSSQKEVCIRRDNVYYCTPYNTGYLDEKAVKIELDALRVDGREFIKYTARFGEEEESIFAQEVYSYILADAETYLEESMKKLRKIAQVCNLQ